MSRNSRATELKWRAIDRLALERAVGIVVRHPERRYELEELMVRLGWQEAAQIAAFDCQSRSLDLPPWGTPPCAAQLDDKGPAGYLLRRMLARGVSRWDPDPLRAIAAAGSKWAQRRARTLRAPDLAHTAGVS